MAMVNYIFYRPDESEVSRAAHEFGEKVSIPFGASHFRPFLTTKPGPVYTILGGAGVIAAIALLIIPRRR